MNRLFHFLLSSFLRACLVEKDDDEDEDDDNAVTAKLLEVQYSRMYGGRVGIRASISASGGWRRTVAVAKEEEEKGLVVGLICASLPNHGPH